MTWGDALRPALFPAGCGMMACVLAEAFQAAIAPGLAVGAERLVIRAVVMIVLYGTMYYLVEARTYTFRSGRTAVLSLASPDL